MASVSRTNHSLTVTYIGPGDLVEIRDGEQVVNAHLYELQSLMSEMARVMCPPPCVTCQGQGEVPDDPPNPREWVRCSTWEGLRVGERPPAV